MSLLEAKNIKKIYKTRFGGASVEALKNVSFTVEKGEYVAIMGEAGSGQTTLLNILAALDKPTEGTVILEDKDLTKVKEKDVAMFRRDNLGFVFQDFNLLDTFSLEDNIYLPLVLAGKKHAEMKQRLDSLAPALGIGEIIKKYPNVPFDLDKYDPNNENVYCLETAISKGAGYETAYQWRTKVNAAVLNPKYSLTKSKLDSAQAYMDYYCDMNNTNMEYGFFKNTVNIFNVVTKSDTYTWYCTKVVWWVYNKYGWDIDSNSKQIDWTTSGLYTLVKDYYYVRYFYSSSKRKAAINDYLASAKKNIVLAEEIMLSPYFTKVFENIREN